MAISAAMTSVSAVVAGRWPCSASSARRSAAFVRFPLWPSAIVRALPCWTSGCAFHHWDEPVVE